MKIFLKIKGHNLSYKNKLIGRQRLPELVLIDSREFDSALWVLIVRLHGSEGLGEAF